MSQRSWGANEVGTSVDLSLSLSEEGGSSNSHSRCISQHHRTYISELSERISVRQNKMENQFGICRGGGGLLKKGGLKTAALISGL